MRRPENMLMVRGRDGIEDVFALLRRGPLATDTETSGLDWRYDRVGAINLAAHRTAVFFCKDALEPAIRFLSDETKNKRELVFHEAKFDLHMLRATFGYHVPYPVHDTKLQSYLLDQRGAGNYFQGDHHLKSLASLFVDMYAKDPENELLKEIKERGGKHKGDWLLAPLRKFAKYSALDSWYTLQLHNQFIERIRGWAQPFGYPSLRSLYRTEQWLLLALRDMEEYGVRVDRYYIERWKESLQKRLSKSRSRLVKLAGGREINFGSTPQLRKLLYKDMGLTTERLNKKKTDYSTDKNAMVRLDHPIGAELLNFRKARHAFGTDANGLLNAIGDDNIVHCDFQQNVETNRMSCRNPNVQGQDKKSGIRRGFVPRKGRQMRFADYSQIEMRLAAHLADEKMLIKGFNTDPDFDTHTATAVKMFGTKDPSDPQRSNSKTMNFAMLFGAGEDNVTEGLMTRMSVKEARAGCIEMGYRPSRAESPHRCLAKLLKQRYRETMSAMPRCAREQEQIVRNRGFSVTAFGYHRFLHESEAYKAFNSWVQGSAAGVMKRGVVRVYRELQLGTKELALQMIIHDETVYESEGRKSTDRKVLELLRDDTFKVPIIAKMSGSKISWQDKKPIELEKK